MGRPDGPGWRRSSHGMFVPADEAAGEVEQRIVEAAAVLPWFGGVTGWAALRWLGALWFGGEAADGITRCPSTWPRWGATSARSRASSVSEERLDPTELTRRRRSPAHPPAAIGDVRDAARLRRSCGGRGRRHGDVRRPVLGRGVGRALLGTSRLHRQSPDARGGRVGRGEQLVAPGDTLGATALGAGRGVPATALQPSRVRPGRAGTSARPTCSTKKPASSASTTGRSTWRDIGAGWMCGGRRHSARSALETFVVTAADAGHREDVVRRMAEARGRARFAAPSARAWTHRASALVDPDRHRRGAPGPGRRSTQPLPGLPHQLIRLRAPAPRARRRRSP